MQDSDSFNDVELTSLAIEIIKDLSEDKPLDANDTFIHKLARDIEEDTVVDMDLCPSFYSGDSLFSAVTTPSTQLTVDNISYPRLSPTILSSCQLSPADSLNQSLPPIPTAKSVPVPQPYAMAKSKSCPRNKKRVTSRSKASRNYNNSSHSATELRKESTSTDISPKSSRATRFSSPYHPPPQYSSSKSMCPPSVTVSNDTDSSNPPSCISPRNSHKKEKVCQVPQFNEFTVVINLSPRHKKRRKKRNSDKKQVFFATNVKKKSKKNKYRGIKRGRSVTQITIKKPKLRPQNSCGGKPERVKNRRTKSNIDIQSRKKTRQYNDRMLCD